MAELKAIFHYSRFVRAGEEQILISWKNSRAGKLRMLYVVQIPNVHAKGRQKTLRLDTCSTFRSTLARGKRLQ